MFLRLCPASLSGLMKSTTRAASASAWAFKPAILWSSGNVPSFFTRRPPSFFPRAFADFSAAFVLSLMNVRSCSARAA